MKKIIKYTLIITAGSFIVTLILSRFADFVQLQNLNVYLDKSGKVIKNVVEYKVDEKFKFENADELLIATTFGQIDIEPSKTNELQIILESKIDKNAQPIDIKKFIFQEGRRTHIKLEDVFNDTSSSSNWIQFNKHQIILSQTLKVRIRIPTQYKELNINSISAEYKIENLKMEQIKANTVSGDMLWVNSEAQNLTASSVSGELDFNECDFKNLKLDTVSGDVSFLNTQPVEFTATFKSVSGELSGDEYFEKYIKDEQLKIGDSDKKISINTISGDAEFHHKENVTED